MKIATRIAAALAAVGLCASASAQLNIDFSNSRGTGIGPKQVLIENIKVLTPVTTPFGTTTVESPYSVIFNFDYPNSLNLVPAGITATTSGCATAVVQVYNSVQGASAPISGATVSMGSRSVSTDAQGFATFSNLPEGLNAVSVYSGGYVAASQVASLSCAVGQNQVAVALSPTSGQTGGLTSGQFRVILTWGQAPSDLDSHLTGPNTDSSRFHVYYADKTDGSLCGLDVDDTSSYGPETVTCPATGTTAASLRNGVYRYSVHHWSGTGTIGTSGANVRLEFSNGTVYNYTPPATGWVGDDDVWTVFELTVNNGTIGVAPVNTITHSVPDFSVQSPKRGANVYGSPESRSLFQNLPKK